jgi:DNA-binding NtrC family response regulator
MNNVTDKLLVVDDSQANCRLVEAIFGREGFEVLVANDGPSALSIVERAAPDVVLLDLRMPGMDGLEVLSELKARAPTVPVVMLTGSGQVREAVRSIKLGAVDYLTKPIDREELVAVVRRALETGALRVEVQQLRRQTQQGASEALAVQMGTSTEISRMVDQVNLVAASNFTVLVLGETGTGKELVAQALHKLSERRAKPFVALDCGAIPELLMESELFGHEKGAFTGAERRKEGRFRLAEGGTCFLDEIGNLPASLQSKLLRALEARQIQPLGAPHATPLDVRFVAATNEDLQDRVARGLFRADLYFRLAQYTIALPPLRARKADIGYLTRRFAEEASVELRRPIQTVPSETLELLEQYEWPGNVRELRNFVRQAVLQTSGLAIRPETVRLVLSQTVRGSAPGAPPPAGQSLREIASGAALAAERQAISDALRAMGGNKSQTAKALRTDYKTLHVKMKHLGLRARDFMA